ncbi:MAG: hypothetical protein LBQ57_01675 [Spirochaetales bacterium]|nr:hypothetical protein [Spirochaetales bacterium]
MKKGLILVFAAVFCAGLPAFSVFAQDQEADPSDFSFDLGLGLGVRRFFNGEYIPGAAKPETFLYQYAGLSPVFRFKKFELALDFDVHFRFDGGDEKNEFELRKEDWEAAGMWEIVNLYLPKIRSMRFGTKGDPFAMRLGDIDGISLGNGFIVSSYTNGLFQPENRVLGAVFDIDGSLVDIPYFGIEAFTANAARFDMFAGRMYVRPLAAFQDSILKDLEVGGAMVMDRDPFYFAGRYEMYKSAFLANGDDDPCVSISGLDFNVPLLKDPVFSFTLRGDRASQNKKTGWMGGVSGRFLRVVTYEGQFRVLDTGFIPGYFDASYDLYRPELYAIYNAENSGNAAAETCKAYLGSLGLSLCDDKIVFKAVSEGPVWSAEGRLYNWQGILMLKEGVVPNFSFDILYDKKNMAAFDDFIVWKRESLVRARFHFHSGPAILSLVYALRYIPTDSGPDRQVMAGVEGRITLY